jgi:ferritin-like metal-binding protein YciE
MKMASLRDLFVEELKDLYNAETQLTKALPKMAKAAQNEELRRALEDHLRQTRGHADRIEQVFQAWGKSPKGKRCIGMEGLIEEGSELMKEDADEDVMDAGLIVAAQKVEHYEIASYGSVCTFAELLGEHEARDLLRQTLEEEKQADRTLTQIAESAINIEATDGEDTEMDGTGVEDDEDSALKKTAGITRGSRSRSSSRTRR